ncbi:MAG: uridine kinase [Planctomycetes bacterium]|nr:uridine kinase [Planctomycetota bacterium]
MSEFRHILIGINGGSGSGKTLVANRIVEELGSRRVVVVPQDAYYRDLSHLSVAERARINFDHPDAFDNELLTRHVEALMNGEGIEIPVYDYVRHNRRPETISVRDHAIVVLEGILVFWFESLRRRMDIKIHVDTPDDIRLLRRIRRDILERGRDLESVLQQYENAVRPMHHTFVEPMKRWADIIVPHGGQNRIAIDIIRAKIDELLRAFPEADAEATA